MTNTLGCGCKICKAGLGEYVNELVAIEKLPPNEVLRILQTESIKISESGLKNHLSAFDIEYLHPSEMMELRAERIEVDFNNVDFSEYDFEINKPESIIAYLQKINLKIYLNQAKITMQAQENLIAGNCPDMPREIIQNLAVAFQILDKSTGLSTHVNQQEAIKTVESLGLSIQQNRH